jgi:ABC-type branched-subunit amino acid transport system substrate-binding protein
MALPCKLLAVIALSCALFLPASGQAASLCAEEVARNSGAVVVSTELRRVARLCLSEGEKDAALLLIERIPAEEQLPGDAVGLAAAQIALGQAVKEGVGILLAIDPLRLEAPERVQRWQALLQGMTGAGEKFNALTVIDHSLPLAAGAEREELCRQEQTLLRGASANELSAFAGRLGVSALRYDLQTERARRAVQAGEAVLARQYLDEVLNSQLLFCRRIDALQLRDEIGEGVWLRRAIGVILPLQDKFASFGEAVQRGIDMALAERPPQAPPLSFVVRNAGSEAEENRRLVTQLCTEERVMAIIGPLTGGAALAAAAEAQRLQIPLLALAQKEGVPEIGDYVFRDALTSHRQVETLVRYASAGGGRKRFAILAPENRLGQEFADLFSQAVLRHGGTVVTRQGYNDSDSDFRTPVKLLKGENPAIPDPPAKESSRLVVRSAPLPFDVLFIPDVGERVALIASYLAYYGVENVQILGTSAWNSPELLERSARYVDGAVFVDGFYAGSSQPRVRDFVDRYSERYGDEPTLLEAQGYDLARLLISLLEGGKIRSRSELRSALAKVKNFPGVSGDLAFDPLGDAVKKPVLLRIQNGTLIAAE